jgi:hypothetical protein
MPKERERSMGKEKEVRVQKFFNLEKERAITNE